MQITADDVILYAGQCAGQPFVTLAKKVPFTFSAEAGGVTFVTHEGKPRVNRRPMLEKYVSIFNRQPEVFATGEYVKENLYDSSYFLTLVSRMIDEGEYEEARRGQAKAEGEAGGELEQEFMRALAKATRRSQHPERDIELIAYYYGFRQDPAPSQVEAAARFGLDDRERARQIIRDYFDAKVEPKDLPVATGIADQLEAVTHVGAGQFLGELRNRKIASETPSARGLLDLLKNGLKRCPDHELYAPDLEMATREKWGRSDQVYFLRRELAEPLDEARTKLRGIPGTLGVAKFEDALGRLGSLVPEQVALLRELVVATPHAWTWEAPDGLWFLFEDKQNPLVNLLKKVHTMTDRCSLAELVPTLCLAIYPHPPEMVVATWLRQSNFLDVRADEVRFLDSCGKVELVGVEPDAREFLSTPANHNCALGPLREWLLAKGHAESNCERVIYRSGLIFVDKSQGRGNYTYRLIGQSPAGAASPDDDRYFRFRERLKNIGKDGTDRRNMVRQRKEQETLQEWIFGENGEMPCATCGRVFDRSALVTAHKKPRHACNELERLDPHIVMPLCVFGCDYLYERGHIYISDGKILAGAMGSVAAGIQVRVGELVGREVPAQWREGMASYFRKP